MDPLVRRHAPGVDGDGWSLQDIRFALRSISDTAEETNHGIIDAERYEGHDQENRRQRNGAECKQPDLQEGELVYSPSETTASLQFGLPRAPSGCPDALSEFHRLNRRCGRDTRARPIQSRSDASL
jgi:hypothetical protein